MAASSSSSNAVDQEEDPFGDCFTELARDGLPLGEVYNACKKYKNVRLDLRIQEEDKRRKRRQPQPFAARNPKASPVFPPSAEESLDAMANRAQNRAVRLACLMGPYAYVNQGTIIPANGGLSPEDGATRPVIFELGWEAKCGMFFIMILVIAAVMRGVHLMGARFAEAKSRRRSLDTRNNTKQYLMDDYSKNSRSRSRCGSASVGSRRRRLSLESDSPPVRAISITSSSTATITEHGSCTGTASDATTKASSKASLSKGAVSLAPVKELDAHSNHSKGGASVGSKGSSHSSSGKGSQHSSQQLSQRSPKSLAATSLGPTLSVSSASASRESVRAQRKAAIARSRSHLQRQRQAMRSALVVNPTQVVPVPICAAASNSSSVAPQKGSHASIASASVGDVRSSCGDSVSSRESVRVQRQAAIARNRLQRHISPYVDEQEEAQSDMDDIRTALQRYYKAYEKRTARRKHKRRNSLRTGIRFPLPSTIEEPELEEQQEEIDHCSWHNHHFEDCSASVSSASLLSTSHRSEQEGSLSNQLGYHQDDPATTKAMVMPKRRPSLGQVSDITEDDRTAITVDITQSHTYCCDSHLSEHDHDADEPIISLVAHTVVSELSAVGFGEGVGDDDEDSTASMAVNDQQVELHDYHDYHADAHLEEEPQEKHEAYSKMPPQKEDEEEAKDSTSQLGKMTAAQEEKKRKSLVLNTTSALLAQLKDEDDDDSTVNSYVSEDDSTVSLGAMGVAVGIPVADSHGSSKPKAVAPVVRVEGMPYQDSSSRTQDELCESAHSIDVHSLRRTDGEQMIPPPPLYQAPELQQQASAPLFHVLHEESSSITFHSSAPASLSSSDQQDDCSVLTEDQSIVSVESEPVMAPSLKRTLSFDVPPVCPSRRRRKTKRRTNERKPKTPVTELNRRASAPAEHTHRSAPVEHTQRSVSVHRTNSPRNSPPRTPPPEAQESKLDVQVQMRDARNGTASESESSSPTSVRSLYPDGSSSMGSGVNGVGQIINKDNKVNEDEVDTPRRGTFVVSMMTSSCESSLATTSSLEQTCKRSTKHKRSTHRSHSNELKKIVKTQQKCISSLQIQLEKLEAKLEVQRKEDSAKLDKLMSIMMSQRGQQH